MKRLMNKVEKVLKNERGDILQMVVIIIVVVAVAVNTMPKLMKGIIDEGDKSVTSLTTDINKAYTPAADD